MTKINWMEVFYPPRCLVCDRVLTCKEERVCRICQKKGLPMRIREPLCKCCGKPVSKTQREFCFDCEHVRHEYSQGRAVFAYRGMEETMHRFKDGNRREYRTYFGAMLAETVSSALLVWHPDMVHPIPLHSSKRRRRGYNQAELLANSLSEHIRIPLRTELLIRRKESTEQKALGAKERRQNLKDAFSVAKPEEIKEKRILLVDDIYTTGSTIDAAAAVLRQSGAKEVFFVSVCIGKGD